MNFDEKFVNAFDALLEKYAELLIGDGSPDAAEKVRYWALYSHIHKTMPAIVSHWNAVHPEQKATVRELFEEIRDKGRLHRERGTRITSDSESGQPTD